MMHGNFPWTVGIHAAPGDWSWTFAHVQPPGGLVKYYRENVTGGPGAFVLEVHDFHSFSEAMTRKLVTEIAGQDSASRVAAAP